MTASLSAYTPPPWRVSKEKQVMPYAIAGIVNITPDSFSDGGTCFSLPTAMQRVQQHIEEGASLIDLGAESTRPAAAPVDHEEELKRLLPVLQACVALQKSHDITLCIDTYKASTAQAALAAGAEVINDISGGTLDPGMLDLIVEYQPGFVIGHCPAPPQTMQAAPAYTDVIDSILAHFNHTMDSLVRRGYPEEGIVLDPCIGFGKTLEHNLTVFRNLDRLRALGRPLYFGISRKRFIADLTGADMSNRDTPTQLITALLASQGVSIHRVHHVAPAKLALHMASLFSPTERLPEGKLCPC